MADAFLGFNGFLRPVLVKIPRLCNQPPKQPAVIHKVMCNEVHDLALALDLAIYTQQA